MTCDNYYHPDVTGKGTPNMKPISNNKNALPHRGLRKVMALALAFLMLVCGGTLSAVRAAAITAYKMPALDASDAEFKKRWQAADGDLSTDIAHGTSTCSFICWA